MLFTTLNCPLQLNLFMPFRLLFKFSTVVIVKVLSITMMTRTISSKAKKLNKDDIILKSEALKYQDKETLPRVSKLNTQNINL